MDRRSDAPQLPAFQPTSRSASQYDVGDGWEHEIVVERVARAAEGASPPRVLGGARACPPEDCDGVHGYAELLEGLGDPDHPEHEELADWLPEGRAIRARGPVRNAPADGQGSLF